VSATLVVRGLTGMAGERTTAVLVLLVSHDRRLLESTRISRRLLVDAGTVREPVR
jgi:hypothetical protein